MLNLSNLLPRSDLLKEFTAQIQSVLPLINVKNAPKIAVVPVYIPNAVPTPPDVLPAPSKMSWQAGVPTTENASQTIVVSKPDALVSPQLTNANANLNTNASTFGVSNVAEFPDVNKTYDDQKAKETFERLLIKKGWIESATAYLGASSNNEMLFSLDDCKNKCMSNDKCQAVTYSFVNGKCNYFENDKNTRIDDAANSPDVQFVKLDYTRYL
jgi:hypothetical protein